MTCRGEVIAPALQNRSLYFPLIEARYKEEPIANERKKHLTNLGNNLVMFAVIRTENHIRVMSLNPDVMRYRFFRLNISGFHCPNKTYHHHPVHIRDNPMPILQKDC